MAVFVEDRNRTTRVPAWTYVSNDYGSATTCINASMHERAPSERYAKLVLCGVEEQGLPKSYARALRKHLQHLGLSNSSLDCSSPLEPLWNHGGAIANGHN